MIEKIILTNFKVHKSTALKLGPKVTTIVGPSDAGKSTVVQALKWAALNYPSGDGFLRHGESKVEVDVIADGRHVQRRKGSGGNAYELDGQILKAFGTGVPADVSNVLGLHEVNFQSQFDPPFWMMDSAGEVSRNLNRIVNLSIIDSSLAFINKELRTAKSKEEITLQQWEEAKKAKRNLAWVVDVDGRLTILEEMERDLQNLQNRISRNQDLIESATAAKTKVNELRNVGERFKKVTYLHATWTNAINTRKHHEALVRSAVIARDAMRSTPDFSRVVKLRTAADATAEHRRVHESYVETAREYLTDIQRIDRELELWREKLKNCTPEICPTCGQEITSSPPSGTCTSTSTHQSSEVRKPLGPKRSKGSGIKSQR